MPVHSYNELRKDIKAEVIGMIRIREVRKRLPDKRNIADQGGFSFVLTRFSNDANTRRPGSITMQKLSEWVDNIQQFAAEGSAPHVFFNSHYGQAVRWPRKPRGAISESSSQLRSARRRRLALAVVRSSMARRPLTRSHLDSGADVCSESWGRGVGSPY